VLVTTARRTYVRLRLPATSLGLLGELLLPCVAQCPSLGERFGHLGQPDTDLVQLDGTLPRGASVQVAVAHAADDVDEFRDRRNDKGFQLAALALRNEGRGQEDDKLEDGADPQCDAFAVDGIVAAGIDGRRQHGMLRPVGVEQRLARGHERIELGMVGDRLTLDGRGRPLVEPSLLRDAAVDDEVSKPLVAADVPD